MKLWDVDIHSDNHVHFRKRLEKTETLKRAVLFQAGCACWILGGAFCIAASWLAGWRRKLGSCEGPFCFFLSVKTGAL
jgi:hypothetical protein